MSSNGDALGGWADLEPDVDVDGVSVDPVTGEVGPRAIGDVERALTVLAGCEEAAAAAGRLLGAAEDALADAAGAVRVAQAKLEDLGPPEAPAAPGDGTGWQRVAANEEVEAAERRRRRAAAEVARLQDLLELRLDAAAQAREDLDDARAAAAAPAGDDAAGDEEEGPELYFGTLDEFVREVIAPTFCRKIDTRGASRWAPDWWRHPEAVLRLEALWRSWEYLRLDPATGMSVWLRDHADPHLAVLFSDYGPFARTETTSQLGDPLPCDPPPHGLFSDVRLRDQLAHLS